MEFDKQHLSGPLQPWHDSPLRKMCYRDSDHVPFSKRRNEVKSVLNVNFTRHPERKRVEISVEEITTTDKRVSGRTISFTLSEEHAKKLAKFMAEGE
jgi:hypothetical protein